MTTNKITNTEKQRATDVPVEPIVILRSIINANPEIKPYRSGGFLNNDYDRAMICFSLPISEANKLFDNLIKI